MSTRQRITILATQLYDRRGTPDVDTLLELLALRVQALTDTLITADGTALYRAQGEAAAYKRLIADITRKSPTQTESP